MKKQNGFISSSSTVATKYSTRSITTGTTSTTSTVSAGSSTSSWSSYGKNSPYSIMTQYYSSYDGTQSYSWNTYETTCYERIEYFLEVNEKLGEPFSKSNYYYQSISNYDASVAREDIYNGFVDLVITLPCEIRLAGVELLNPWISERFDSSYADYWRYLPTKFNIYKVNNEYRSSETTDFISYEGDIVNSTNFNDQRSIRPIRYNKLNSDVNLTLLGTYKDINWKNISSYKCFFKYNYDDEISKNATLNSNVTGTATWNCKQLVIRIFETNIKLNHLNTKIPGKTNDSYTYIKELILEYILGKETEYGTTYAGLTPTLDQISGLFGKSGISSAYDFVEDPAGINDKNWNFGSQFVRSYKYVKDLKFKSGIDYKLGGIQLLISPDIFSISEMKMYNYAGRDCNRVYIGEYDPEFNDVIYYGVKNIRQSPYIDISKDSNAITWCHNFNIPANYLQADIFIRFNMDYDTFKMGDVVGNIVNVENAPLSIKLTDTQVSVSLNNGIGFVNPNTGEFVSFMNGIGIQMDRPGNFDALQAAIDVGANIIEAGSSVAASITGGCPFQIYFIVKRLF